MARLSPRVGNMALRQATGGLLQRLAAVETNVLLQGSSSGHGSLLG